MHRTSQAQTQAQPHTDQAIVRASDTDRDIAIETLRDALAEGALDTAEHDRRLQQAMTATTMGDLAALTADLPVSRASLTKREAQRRDADKREWFNEWGHWAGGAVIMTAIGGFTSVQAGELKYFWPMVPLGIWAAILISYAIWPGKDDRHGLPTHRHH
ncbi:DUF1707 domain-containing protein [Actinomadura barringtoniae]|uniref:DUF1707 domain-containing protein n=2 Tax=Actinomadura barringtoniae TaxID=1427535 RepID=A0A939TFT4_9ACTN|nr:DUF1707 domain-containing protein [Actinomadura barringtoniae]